MSPSLPLSLMLTLSSSVESESNRSVERPPSAPLLNEEKLVHVIPIPHPHPLMRVRFFGLNRRVSLSNLSEQPRISGGFSPAVFHLFPSLSPFPLSPDSPPARSCRHRREKRKEIHFPLPCPPLPSLSLHIPRCFVAFYATHSGGLCTPLPAPAAPVATGEVAER